MIYIIGRLKVEYICTSPLVHDRQKQNRYERACLVENVSITVQGLMNIKKNIIASSPFANDSSTHYRVVPYSGARGLHG
jgi:hypothetical protein